MLIFQFRSQALKFQLLRVDAQPGQVGIGSWLKPLLSSSPTIADSYGGLSSLVYMAMIFENKAGFSTHDMSGIKGSKMF